MMEEEKRGVRKSEWKRKWDIEGISIKRKKRRNKRRQEKR